MKKGRQTMEPLRSPLEDYVTVDVAAKYLQCSRARIYELGKTGRLELVKYFGRTLVSQKSAEDVLKQEIRPLKEEG